MSMSPDELNNFVRGLSNSASGPMPKKRSAAAIQRAKAKSLKGAAAIALGKPMGKKGKDSKGNNAGSKGSGSKGSGSKGSGSSSSSSKSKPVMNTGSPYATTAVSKAKSISDAKNASLIGAARAALGSPSTRQYSLKKYERAYEQAAGMALGNPLTKQPKTAPKKK
jgi:hypothetical protein